MFDQILESIKNTLIEKAKEIGAEALDVVDDASELFKVLDIEDRVIDWLAAHDRDPNSSKLNMIPYIPSKYEKMAVRKAIRIIYFSIASTIQRKLKEIIK